MISERHIRELIVHGIAFCLAAAIGAIILSRYYAIFEHDTDSAAGAREAYLMCAFIVGGVGPAITSLIFVLHRLVRRQR
jgi:hypothetical protein